jgi:NodT family efflux transporter outer membrane factor (OMF) lipoprotein
MIQLKRVSILLGLPIAFLTGCQVVNEDYKQPVIPDIEEANWSIVDEGVFSKADLQPEQLATWWTQFDDPELDELVEAAIAGNLELRSAQARLQKARLQWKNAGSGQLPTVQSNSSVMRAQGSGSTGSGNAATLYSTGLDAGWEIDLFGGMKAAEDSAESQVQAAEEDQRNVLVSVIGEVAMNYADLKTAAWRRSLAENQLKTLVDYRKIIQAKVDAGFATELDVNRADATIDKARAGIPLFNQQIEMSLNRLAVLTGEIPGSIELGSAVTEGPIQPPTESIAIGVPAQVLRQRPDVRSAERRLASATYQIGVARSDLYPKLRLTGTIGLESTSSSNLLSAASGLFGIGPNISWNLFNGGRVRNEIEIKSIEQEEALIAYEKTVMGALEEVQNGIVFLAQEQVRKKNLSDVLEKTKKTLSLAKLRYEAGETDYLNVLDAEREHLVAIDQLASSEGLIAVYLIRLYKALGGGWESQFPETE